MNGVVLGVLTRGIVAPVPVHGAQGLEVDLTGLVVEITVVVLLRLPLLTQRMDLRHPGLKVKVEVRVFGRVWRQAVSVRISITEPHNPARNPNRRLGIGKDQGRRDHPGGLVSLSRRFHPNGDRSRGPTMIEVKGPRT